jgi:site-specific recombinase XerD
MPRVEIKLIQTFSKEQVRALFAVCDQEHTPALAERDKAILAVLLDTGIRARELCSLTLV